jgi:hypothetical protein
MSDIVEPILRLGPPFNMVVFLMLIGGIVAIIGTLTKQIRKFACHRAETNLKHDLVERGLSVEEIERVIAAKSPAMKQSDVA